MLTDISEELVIVAKWRDYLCGTAAADSPIV
jgi:hypothetical protein